MDNLTLKQVNAEDWEIIQKIELSVPKSNIFWAITTKDKIEAYIQQSQVFCIYKGEELCGSISYETKADNSIYLDGLVVLPQYQKQGIGSQALDMVIEKFEDNPKIWLYTHPHNTASLRLYLKKGFIITKWVDNLFGDGEPRLVLEKN